MAEQRLESTFPVSECVCISLSDHIPTRLSRQILILATNTLPLAIQGFIGFAKQGNTRVFNCAFTAQTVLWGKKGGEEE